jgi:hypothetical protein
MLPDGSGQVVRAKGVPEDLLMQHLPNELLATIVEFASPSVSQTSQPRTMVEPG